MSTVVTLEPTRGETSTVSRELPPARLDCLEALEQVYDPEIPVNLVDLGLVYRVDVTDEGEVQVDMTLTSLGCPEAPRIIGEVRKRLLSMSGVTDCTVNLVWEPLWNPEFCTDEGRLQLRMLGVPL